VLDTDEGKRSDEREAHDGTNHRRWSVRTVIHLMKTARFLMDNHHYP
jgi:hypothetical protein